MASAITYKWKLTLTVFLTSLFYVFDASRKTVVKLGVILPFNGNSHWTISKMHPALDIALESINAPHSSMLHDHVLMATLNDSKCSASSGPLAAIEMHCKQSAHVFFGPFCDYSLAPVARYAPSWNIPVITVGGMATAFDNKGDEYKLLTRMSSPYSKAAEAVENIFSQFQWRNIVILYYTQKGRPKMRHSCYSQSQALVDTLSRSGTPYKIWHDAFNNSRSQDNEALKDMLRRASARSRIIVLCAGADRLVRQIMLQAADLKLTSGGYAFINIDLFSSKVELERPWYMTTDTHQQNARARTAFEALITIILKKPDNVDYRNFLREVKRRAMRSYNYRYDEDQVNIFAGSLHDAVILYALALNETLAAGFDVTNGKEVTKRMWNRTFQGITGTVIVDENGDRVGDYSILDLNPRTGRFEVVANYFGNRTLYEPVDGKSIHWPGDDTLTSQDGTGKSQGRPNL